MNDFIELEKQIEALRVNLIRLHGELAALKPQVRSRNEVRALVLEQVATWRAQASAAVAVDLQCMTAGQTVPLLEMRAVNGVISFGPILVSAMGEAALSEWLNALTDYLPEGLDAIQRAERIHDISKEIELVEAAEEGLLREADDLGRPIDPRADADPRAALIVGWGES